MSAVKAIKYYLTESYSFSKPEAEEIAKHIKRFISDPTRTTEDIEVFFKEELNMKSEDKNRYLIQRILTSSH